MEPRNDKPLQISTIIELERAFLQELQAILRNSNEIDRAVTVRQSILNTDPKVEKFISLSQYLQNPDRGSPDQKRALTHQQHNLSIVDLNKRPLIDRIALEAAIWEAHSRVMMKEQEKSLKATYGQAVIITNAHEKLSQEELGKQAQYLHALDKVITISQRNVLKHISDFNLTTDYTSKKSRANDATLAQLAKIENRYNMREQAVIKTIESIVEKTNHVKFAYEDLIKDRKWGWQKHFSFMSHEDATHKLRVGILEINKNNKLSPEQKLEKMTAFLEQLYTSKFDPKQQSAQDYVDKLNSQPKDHHIARITGMLLEEAYAAHPDPTERKAYHLAKIKMPDERGYNQLFTNRKSQAPQPDAEARPDNRRSRPSY